MLWGDLSEPLTSRAFGMGLNAPRRGLILLLTPSLHLTYSLVYDLGSKPFRNAA